MRSVRTRLRGNPLFPAGVVQLAIRLVEIAMERSALVVVQTVAALVVPAPLGTEFAALPCTVVPALLGLRGELESRVTPGSRRRRSREPGGERNRGDQCFHFVRNRL